MGKENRIEVVGGWENLQINSFVDLGSLVIQVLLRGGLAATSLD